MEKIIRQIIKLRKTILISFGILVIISIFLLQFNEVNYKMVDYLPEDANSTMAIRLLEEEFEGGLPNLSVMVKTDSVKKSLYYKSELAKINGVNSIRWLDDILGVDTLITQPISFQDEKVVKSYYKDGYSLYLLEIEEGLELTTTNEIYELIGEDNNITGEALSIALAQDSSVKEVRNALLILIPIILIVLLIATNSWIEPIMFMITIGVAIIINMGTNVFFGEVSFITQTVSPILQLAVSMDYAIFLLHNFTDMREKYEPKEAMFHAIKISFPTIGASALTTMVGFSSLIFMRFGIGSDLGINLLKGIALSFISVMIFLPVLCLVFYNAIEKTSHKNFLPKANKISKVLLKIKVPIFILAMIIVVPAFLGQSNVDFIYGMPDESVYARSYLDRKEIDNVFGAEQLLLIIVPKQETVKEEKLISDLENLPLVNDVVSFTNSVSSKIPKDFIPKNVLNQFYSDEYSRIILHTSLEPEGEETFMMVEKILSTTENYYDEYYITGEAATMNDMRKSVDIDMGKINLIAMIGIFTILLFTFKSISIPIILIFTIQTAIWVNLSIPYFNNTSISFVGFLIISTVQLGATVDYAIFITNKYLYNRRKMDKNKGMLNTLKSNITAVMVSAIILSSAGFALSITTTNMMIKDLGLLLGRGTILSFISVAVVLPALLIIFDRVIINTTLNHNFYKGEI